MFNYFLSENQVRLAEFKLALALIIQRAKDETLFVVIDRLERNTTFRQDVIDVLQQSGLTILEQNTIEGVMDDDESILDDYVKRFGRRPRRWFRTPQQRHPTVFWIVAQKLIEDYNPF